MFGMGCEIYRTPENIQHATINRLPCFIAQRMIEGFRIIMAKITYFLNAKTSQIVCRGLADTGYNL